jgi:hypothetical protein
MIERIISGGQTGVDRAALDAALELGILCGGWCPPDCLAEDGVIAECYGLNPTLNNVSPDTPDVPNSQRTEWNVRDSDGTLVLTRGGSDRGTEITRWFAERLRRPCEIIDLNNPQPLAVLRAWVTRNNIRILNVAGPRESSQPGIYAQALPLLRALFTAVGVASDTTPDDIDP